jgi:chorismate mutase
MPDGSRDAHVPMSAEDLDEAERRALIAAVAEARADPHPPIPHEEVRAEIMAEIEELERRIAASLAAPPTA